MVLELDADLLRLPGDELDFVRGLVWMFDNRPGQLPALMAGPSVEPAAEVPPEPAAVAPSLQCPECGRGFASSSGLSIHQGRSHGSKAAKASAAGPVKKSYECEPCGVKFPSPQGLGAHNRRVHPPGGGGPATRQKPPPSGQSARQNALAAAARAEPQDRPRLPDPGELGPIRKTPVRHPAAGDPVHVVDHHHTSRVAVAR